MNSYELVKAFHIISMTAWMAGMLYLPRLFVYHSGVAVGSEPSELFKLMERRLLRAIMNPAMILTWSFGMWLAIQSEVFAPGSGNGWMHVKLLFVLCMSGLHGYFSVTRKAFARDERPKSGRFYRIINEVVTVIFAAIVLLVITKPL